MKKSTKIIIIVVAIIAIIAVVAAVVIMNKKTSNNNGANITQTGSINGPQEVNTVEDLSKLLNQVYAGVTTDIYNVETQTIDLTNETSVKSYTGLENAQNLEFAIVSEPLINAQAYSLVMAKVKDDVDANDVAKAMAEGVDTRKWICVSAEKLYATNSGNIVFLIMTNEEMANNIYKSFKDIVGTIGNEYEKTEREELPPDMGIPAPQ